ncbi:MAG: hypothetical protein ACPHJ3_20550, partial [Rubripirellula sp.]
MSSSFDQPDEGAFWGWNYGKVRTTDDILSDVDAALNLLDQVIESEVAASPFPESGNSDQIGLSNGDLCTDIEFPHPEALTPVFSRFGEPLWVASQNFLLQQ